MKLLSSAAILVLLALSLLPFFVLRSLLLVFLEKLRLKARGEHAEGICTGYSSGRYGNGVEIRFEDGDGRSRRTLSHSWRGTLPERGDTVGVVYLPGDPEVSDVSPIRSLLPNAVYMAVIVPLLTTVGASGVLLAIFLAHSVWF
ncbi:hypothetical protein ACFVS9_30065 [Streptomyces sp. NPDC058008]|uniref:hypothetical protein n=1 Tax=Streptomyces sp. NPDC058008 TaxID=3346303 RepID=UPI0036E03315